jgi:branched-chain amino acid aminotransferase
MQYINFNGNIYPGHETLLPVTNRAYRYGDGFFESLVMFNKKVPLLEYHWSRIEFTTQVISATLPSRLDMDKLEGMLLDLASVNDAVKNARFRLQFYRKGMGMFLPDDDELGYSITVEKLENTKFETGEGLVAGVREDCYKAISMVSDIKNSSALMYVLASQFARAEGWDECLLTNHYGQLCEALNANIFLVKDNKISTPDLDSGCVNGVMRSYLLWALDGKVEERDIEIKDAADADEILLTNAVKGVQWVKEFQGKLYTGKKATEITELLNQKLLTVT